jgi:hypothetical protein
VRVPSGWSSRGVDTFPLWPCSTLKMILSYGRRFCPRLGTHIIVDQTICNFQKVCRSNDIYA